MTSQTDEGHTGLDRENNQDPGVNQLAKETSDAPSGGDALQERMDELTDAASDADS